MGQTKKELSLKEEIWGAHDISYERYLELGGIINEDDYLKTLVRAAQIIHLREYFGEGLRRELRQPLFLSRQHWLLSLYILFWLGG